MAVAHYKYGMVDSERRRLGLPDSDITVSRICWSCAASRKVAVESAGAEVDAANLSLAVNRRVMYPSGNVGIERRRGL